MQELTGAVGSQLQFLARNAAATSLWHSVNATNPTAAVAVSSSMNGEGA